MEREIALDLVELDTHIVRDWLGRQAHTHFVRQTQLTNVYFDTPQHDLRRQRSAVRLRFDAQAQQWLQTLKLAHTRDVEGMVSRHEWEVAIDTLDASPSLDLTAFPAEAQAHISPYFNELKPLFKVEFTRDIFVFQTPDEQLEWALDEGTVSLIDGPHITRPIRDLELEWYGGDDTQMRHLAQQAAAQLSIQPQMQSKAARGFTLWLAHHPDPML